MKAFCDFIIEKDAEKFADRVNGNIGVMEKAGVTVYRVYYYED